jgi:hypothetical protein
MNPRDTFRERLEHYGVEEIETVHGNPEKLYVFPNEGGYGIPEDCYDGLDVRLIESFSVERFDEDHRLYHEGAHHVLIFKVSEDQ